VLQLIAAVKAISVFCHFFAFRFSLRAQCFVLLLSITAHFTVTSDYCQTGDNVLIEKKTCSFSFVVLFTAQNVEITKFCFYKT